MKTKREPRRRDDVVRKMRPMADLMPPPTLALHRDEGDADAFIDQVGAIIRGIVREYDPAEVYMVKIDTWFGQRWLGFSHKVLGVARAFSVSALRVPPFIPHCPHWA